MGYFKWGGGTGQHSLWQTVWSSEKLPVSEHTKDRVLLGSLVFLKTANAVHS